MITDKGLQLLKQLETLRLTAYDDQTGKPITAWCSGATIGYGHLIAENDWGEYRNGISESEALQLLLSDLEPYSVYAGSLSLSPEKTDALIIFSFNIGLPSLKKSTAMKFIADRFFKSSQYPSLEDAWKAWNKSKGKVMNGLVKRRAVEWRLFSTGVYSLTI
jgi:lysozyme